MNTDEPIWEDHHHRSMFLPNTSSGSHDFASLFPTDIVNVPQSPILLQDTDFEETFATLLRRTRLTYQPSLMLLSTFMLGRTATQMNLKHIRHFLRNSVIFLRGHMKRCWGLTHPLWSMRLKPIPRLNLSGKN